MALLRSDARVLKTYPLGETSLIAVLLTAESGVIRAVAKGAREAKSRFRGLMETGWPLRVLVYEKRGGLHLLKEASLRGALPRPSRRLETMVLRLAAIELILLSSEDDASVAGLFELLEDYLGLFDQGEEEGPLPLFAFEAGLLSLHGLGLDLERCGACGELMDPAALRFLPGEGQFSCRRHASEGIDLAPDEADWLKSVFLARPSALAGRLLGDDARRRIGRVLHLALSRHLPGYRLPRSLTLLKSLGREEPATDEEPGP